MSEEKDLELTPEMEMKMLKERADLMKINYAPNIGLETLRERVNAKLKSGEEEEEKKEVKAVASAPVKQYTVEELKRMSNNRLRKEAQKLVRVVVTCMNPDKREWHGEVFTVGNAVIGTIKKFVPFNNEEGYHVPQAILTQIQNRKYQHFVKKPIPGTRQTKLIPTMSREFNVQILPPLNKKELDELARKQALNHSID